MNGSNTRSLLLLFAAAIVAVTLDPVASVAQESSTVLSAKALAEIAQVEAEIDRIEVQTIERLAKPPDNQVQQIELLGKLMLYDKELSVNRNEACAFCHMPEVGFTGPVSELNRTTGSYPGSVRTRFSERKPQLRAALAGPALQSRAGRSRRRQFLGHAGDRASARQSGRRAGTGAAHQPGGNGPARYSLRRLSCLAAALSSAV
jgi:cytochrome c peroxidase